MTKQKIKTTKKSLSSSKKKESSITKKRSSSTKKKKSKNLGRPKKVISNATATTVTNILVQTKDRLSKRRIHTKEYATSNNTKLCITREIIKNKSGGFSLKVDQLRNDLSVNPIITDDEDTLQQSTKYIGSIGLLRFLGNVDNQIWNGTKKVIPISNRNKGYSKTQNINFLVGLTNPQNDAQKKSPEYGKERGIIIHQELEHFVYLDIKNFNALHPNPHPMTINIIKALGNRNYVGLHSEYPIYFVNEEGKDAIIPSKRNIIASSIDLICFDKTNQKIVLVETKTGYSNGDFFECFAKTHTKKNKNNNVTQKSKMYGDFSVLSDCPINRSKLQLCVYMLYFRSILKENCQGTILHCTNDGVVQFYDMDEGFYYKYSRFLSKKLFPLK